MNRVEKERRVQMRDGKVFEINNLTIDVRCLNPNYSLLKQDSAALGATGRLDLFELRPKSGGGPAFFGRWDGGSRDQGKVERDDLDIDISGVSRAEQHRFESGKNGYAGHHSSRIPSTTGRAAYCNICNFESYTNAIMGDPAQRAGHIKDATDFFSAVKDGTLPAVSFVKPDGLLDGHPASSKEDLFEGMVKKVVDALTANEELFASTVLFITMDEGGGYYDSGYIQPVDFFGDGPRIPLIAVSPFTRGGHISHTYTDHVSILKFIERNWNLEPLTHRSRDNFPNPIVDDDNPYVPLNSPALGDLFDLFHFDHERGQDDGDHGDNH